MVSSNFKYNWLGYQSSPSGIDESMNTCETGGGKQKWYVLCSPQDRRAIQKNMVYIDDQRVMMKYLFPLNEIVVDFYDLLKSLSSGYAR